MFQNRISGAKLSIFCEMSFHEVICILRRGSRGKVLGVTPPLNGRKSNCVVKSRHFLRPNPFPIRIFLPRPLILHNSNSFRNVLQRCTLQDLFFVDFYALPYYLFRGILHGHGNSFRHTLCLLENHGNS
jgi:hypothetical protein